MLKPVNRMLLVELCREDTQESQADDANKAAFYLPEDVATNKEYEVVTLVDTAEGSQFEGLELEGVQLVVEGHMLREVKVGGKSCYVVQDNYVLGILKM